ncbi:MAG: 4'-phosphopantetheinyl transferase EntD [Gammaproteobacteria bacterium]
MLAVGSEKIVCLQCPIGDYSSSMPVNEQLCISRARAKRRNEYSTGRWLARTILTSFNSENFELLVGKKRQPLWPTHVVGSITHTDTHAAVAVAHKAEFLSIGIDMERINRVTANLVPKLLTRTEQQLYSEVDPTLIFSAKEACYKFLFPLQGEYVDYLSVETRFNFADSTFTLRYIGDSQGNRVADRAQGKFLTIGECWFCIVTMPSA